MNRREFYRISGLLGLGLISVLKTMGSTNSEIIDPNFYEEQAKKLLARQFDVVIAGASNSL